MINRIINKIMEQYYPSVRGSCWVFQGAKKFGYGTIKINKKTYSTHRVIYDWFYDGIPDGLHIDHLCEVKTCCNPLHLEAVTQKVNNNRAPNPAEIKRCRKKGHDTETPGTRTSSGSCRICQNEHNKKYMRKMRGRSSSGRAPALQAEG